jgi:hypothetical protein
MDISVGPGPQGTQLIARSELGGHGANVEANEGESESGPDQNSEAVRFYEAAQSGARSCYTVQTTACCKRFT